MSEDDNEILQFAEDLARKAGELIVEARQKSTLTQEYKGKKELVTSADIAADKLITEAILARYPQHRILSEETFTDRSQLQDLEQPIWIVDPIDGTVNYAHGHNMVAVSIAYAAHGEIRAGVVHAPFSDETFTAIKGQGSFLNGQPNDVSHLQDASVALVATGFPYDKSKLAPILERVETILKSCQDIRRLGSAALDICWVASGRLDGYFESLSPWDFAAARLIALEAGATCGHFNPIPDNTPACIYDRDILISTPEIYDTLRQLLTDHPD